MSESNFSLLSQDEIDTLIEFLTEQSESVESAVLSQDSIDKLISMMKIYGKGPVGNRNALQSVRAVASVMTGTKEWLLVFEEDPETGYMNIYVSNGERKELITPRAYSCACFVGDDSTWGYAISPVQFADIAKTYNVKFTKSVYADVCQRFAEKNFGDGSFDVNDFFLASSKDILFCLADN